MTPLEGGRPARSAPSAAAARPSPEEGQASPPAHLLRSRRGQVLAEVAHNEADRAPTAGSEHPPPTDGDARKSTGADGKATPTVARLIDVAQLAGVAKGTASRVLSGDPTLVTREETRERVLRAASALAYRPHPLARALARRSAQAIALLAPSLGNPAFAPVIRAAQRRAHELGYVLMTAEDPDDQLADDAFARLVQEGRIDGLIIASARPDHRLVDVLERSAAMLPHVFLYREVPGSDANVRLDIRAPAALAADHLTGLGHRAIAHVGGPVGNLLWAEHAAAFQARAESHGAVVSIERVAFAEPSGEEAMRRLLGARPELTAVYTSSLLQAIGVLFALGSEGRAVPSDVSVLAYDDLPLAGYLVPPLSTVAVPVEKLGAAAVDAIISRLRGEPPRDVEVDCEPHIVVRSSTTNAPGYGR